MVFTTFQWFSPGSDWYLLTTPSEYAMSDHIHVMAYIIDFTIEAYEILLIHSLSLEELSNNHSSREKFFGLSEDSLS